MPTEMEHFEQIAVGGQAPDRWAAYILLGPGGESEAVEIES